VFMNRTLANMLISNLVKNALFHNIEKGIVRINILESRLEICNSGIVKALDKSRIFDRFQKGSTDNASNGLGLSVCRAICDYYGFTLSYDFKEQEHCLSINFRKEV